MQRDLAGLRSFSRLHFEKQLRSIFVVLGFVDPRRDDAG
jgi:hypothetical protein